MDYGFNLKYYTPDFIAWAHKVNERNDAKAKESRDNMMNMLRMAGLVASMGGNKKPVSRDSDAGDYYNYESFNFKPQEQADLAILGIDPNFMSKYQLREDDNIWGNSFGAL